MNFGLLNLDQENEEQKEIHNHAIELSGGLFDESSYLLTNICLFSSTGSGNRK